MWDVSLAKRFVQTYSMQVVLEVMMILEVGKHAYGLLLQVCFNEKPCKPRAEAFQCISKNGPVIAI